MQRQSYATGFQPGVLLRSIRSMPSFFRDLMRYNRMRPQPVFRATLKDLFPILSDRSASAGFVGGHYFYQDLWAAQKIFQQKPREHVDIGSRIDGFIAHLLSFREVVVVDIRPLVSHIPGLRFVQDDATELSHFASDSVESLSSLHVAEHFGLGRYGDPVDPDACFRFMAALQRVLAPGGMLYFSVPIGRERVEFNAHRVFNPQTILNAFSRLTLLSFSYIGDDDRLHEKVTLQQLPPSEMACGLFHFTKPAALSSSLSPAVLFE